MPKFKIIRSGAYWALYIFAGDGCGNDYTGQYDYHWTYDHYLDAKRDGLKLS